MAKEKITTDEILVEQTPEQIENEFLREKLAELEKKLSIPNNVQNENLDPIETPERIIFTIGAVVDEDAMIDGAWIPGKALVGAFKYVFPLTKDAYNNYITGFQVEKLEIHTGKVGKDLAILQKNVRIARKYIERLTGNSLDEKNSEFWANRRFRLDGIDDVFDTKNNIDHLILYYNILGGGFQEIGTSYEDALSKGLRIYLSVYENEQERKLSKRITYMKAQSELNFIHDKWKIIDALYLMYYLPLKKQKGFTLNSPKESIIAELADFIDGLDTSSEKMKRPQIFLDALQMFKNNPDIVKTKGLFKAAEYYGFVVQDKDRRFTSKANGALYGNTYEQAVDYLSKEKNIEHLGWLKAKVNEKWTN